MRRELVSLAALLLGIVVPLAATGSSPLIHSSNPNYPSQWLWEPVSGLAPESVGAISGLQNERGQQLTLEAGGVALFHLPRRLLAATGGY